MCIWRVIVYVQRVDSEGNTLWQTGGVQACAGPAEGAQVVSDGAGGAIIAYMRDIPCDEGRMAAIAIRISTLRG